MSLQFASKVKLWCVMFVDGNGRITGNVMFCSIFKSQCEQFMEERG